MIIAWGTARSVHPLATAMALHLSSIPSQRHSLKAVLPQLDDTGLDTLAGSARGGLYARDEAVVLCGESRGQALIIVAGDLAFCVESAHQERTELFRLDGPAVLADIPDGVGVFVASAEAVAYQVPLSDLLRAASGRVDLLRLMLRTFSASMADAADALRALAFEDVSTRLAHCLVRMADAAGGPAVVTSHAELAMQIRTSRQQVCTWLGVLRDEGLLEYDPHHLKLHTIRLLDIERLSRPAGPLPATATPRRPVR